MSESWSDLAAELRSDYELHGSKLSNPAFWPVANYRFGRFVMERDSTVVRTVGGKIYGAALFAIRLLTGSEIHREAKIGKSLHVVHCQNVLISPSAVIGDRVGIMHEVTLGSNDTRGNAPVLGDDVFVGAGAKILGSLKVGDRARVGANSVVIGDVPEDATAIGAPAKILRYTGRPGPSSKSEPPPE